MTWKLARNGLSAIRTLDNGTQESRMVESIPAEELAEALPADPPDYAAEKAAVIKQARELREVIINRLNGIAARAERSGDTTGIAAACDVATLALLGFTTQPTVLAATDGASTKAAVMAIWYSTGAALYAAAPSAADAFKDMGME